MVSLLFLFSQLIIALFFFFLCVALFTGAPFVPSQKNASQKMVAMANISPSDIVYDLGSGDGRLLFMAAQRKPQKIIGLEINILLVIVTNIRLLLSPYRSLIQCKWRNFWSVDISDANVVFVYLLPWKMEALSKKLKKELKPGSRIISNSFLFPDLKMVDHNKETQIYEFVI